MILLWKNLTSGQKGLRLPDETVAGKIKKTFKFSFIKPIGQVRVKKSFKQVTRLKNN